MTITFPLSFPTGDNLGWNQLMFSGQAARGKNENKRTFETQIFEHTGKRWRAQASWVKLQASNAKKIRAFLLSMLEGDGTVLLGDPVNGTPAGLNVGTPLTNGSSNAIGDSDVNTKGWTAGQTGILKAGDDIAISNYLYTVLKDADSDGSGHATLDIFPTLRTAPTDGTAITTLNPVGLFRLEEYQVVWSVSEQKTYDISATFVEAI